MLKSFAECIILRKGIPHKQLNVYNLKKDVLILVILQCILFIINSDFTSFKSCDDLMGKIFIGVISVVM